MKTEEVARLLSEMYGDTCACNYNGADEWLPKYCEDDEEYQCGECGLKCWALFLEHYEERKKRV
jgi:hypothetical protein